MSSDRKLLAIALFALLMFPVLPASAGKCHCPDNPTISGKPKKVKFKDAHPRWHTVLRIMDKTASVAMEVLVLIKR
jgi:hypothetical protein